MSSLLRGLFERCPDGHFVVFLSCSALLLYAQTFLGGYGYVWDDRAAIVSNKDVTGESSLGNLFLHDFWGQDIKSADSHKSYRPITTLSFRLNHNLHGLHAAGFHLTNVLIYACDVVLAYAISQQWLSSRLAARVAAVLFCFHPVHVEAVASLVGRADSLCCLFYLLVVGAYTRSLRSKSEGRAAAGKWLLMLGAAAGSIVACFTKEVGVTIYGLLIALEIAHVLWKWEKQRESDTPPTRPAATHPTTAESSSLSTSTAIIEVEQQSFKTGLTGCLSATRIALTERASGLRIAAIVFFLAFLSVARVRFNGQQTLYSWTVLENHVHLLPSFRERVLSYAQTHFWYLAKLFFPRYLCFDYGYACIPTVHTLLDPRNLLPLAAYLALGTALWDAVRRQRSSVLLALALLLLPLLPALNVLFPIGTTLAERLLFLPSVGFCMLAGELLVEDSKGVWALAWRLLDKSMAAVVVVNKVKSSATNTPPQPYLLLYFFCAILCSLGALRTVVRNSDWASEMQVYRSALFVCPLSAKALTNYAVLCAQHEPTLRHSFHNCLAAAHSALDVYDGQFAAHVNVGVVHQRLTNHALHAVWYWKQGANVPSVQSTGRAKALGYYGTVMLDWLHQLKNATAGSQGFHQDIRTSVPAWNSWGEGNHLALVASAEQFIAQDAIASLDQAFRMGFEPPSALLARGKAALKYQPDYDLARRCFELGRAKVLHERSQSPDAPLADTAPLLDLCLGLGEALLRLGQHAGARDAFACALREDSINPIALIGMESTST